MQDGLRASIVPDESGVSTRRPRALPGFEILGPIGQGGMGVVDLARQVALDRLVAIKWLTLKPGPELEQRIARFRREAELMARVSHPNILTIHDFGVVDGWPYLVMEYVEGGDLRRLMTPGRPLPCERIRSILRPVCDAVDYLHRQDILHRDLKPENILLQGGHVPKVTDFGIAVIRDSAGSLTRTHEGLGTPGYVSPEQQYHLGIDEPADQYSLGAMTYELLTGEKPLGVFSAPSLKNPRVGTKADEVVLRALQENPKDRFPSVRDFAEALDEALAERPRPREAAPVPPIRPRGDRWASLGLLGCVLVIVALVGSRYWRGDGSTEPDPTTEGRTPEVAVGVGVGDADQETEPSITEEQLIKSWAYLLWLDQGKPVGDEGERVRPLNHQRAEALVREELQRLAFEIWTSRGSLIFPDDVTAAKEESDRNWIEAHKQLKVRLDGEIKTKETEHPQPTG